MSNQYFQNNPNIKSEPYYIEYYYFGNKMSFKSDNGVFSKHNVDFGTNLLLKNIILKDHDKVLDVGCGIGIIGISLAKKNNTIDVDMVDVNLRAIGLANENILLNKVKNIQAFESNAYENISDEYDLIITNPPIRAGKKVVHEIVLGGKNHLKNDGKILVVIQKKQGAESCLKAMQEVYTKVDVIDKDKGYFIIKGVK